METKKHRTEARHKGINREQIKKERKKDRKKEIERDTITET